MDNDWINLRNEPKTQEEVIYNAAPTAFAQENTYTRRGGDNWLSMSAFAEWLGPVDVDDSNRLTYFNKSSLYMLANEPHLKDSNPYRQDYQVQNVDLYAYPLKTNGLVTRKQLEHLAEKDMMKTLLQPMKEQIVRHGALAGAMNTKFFNKDRTLCYDPGDPWPYEKNKNRRPSTNHIVTFVGWDDNIPKECFSDPMSKGAKSKYFSEDEFTPPGDGAWICKNSWGESAGSNGFFYLSYYDGGLRETFNCFAGYEAVDIERNAKLEKDDPNKKTVYDNNYQYNSMATSAALNDNSGRTAHQSSYATAPITINQGKHFGAFYTAQTKEKLKAVGICTREENLKLDIDIYVSSDSLPIGEKDKLEETGWEKKSSTTGAAVPNAGFHTIKITTPVDLQQGDNFLVVFTMQRPNGGDVIIEQGTDDNGKYARKRSIDIRGQDYYLESEYYYKRASGYSFDDVNSDMNMLSYQDDYDYDIKAFTVNNWDDQPKGESRLEFTNDYKDRKLEIGESVDMSKGLIFEPVSHNGVWDKIAEWTVSDTNILRNDGNGVFTALSVNDTPVSVNVVTVSGASAWASIRVVEKEADYGISVKLSKTSYDYTGSLISVSRNVTVLSGNTVIYDGTKTVSGFNVKISENGAIDAGEAVATVVVSLSGDSVSKNTTSDNNLLKIADLRFTINPVNLNNKEKITDLKDIDGKELASDGAEHKLVPELMLSNEDGTDYMLVSRNTADYYEYDYDMEYMSPDYSSEGYKTIKVTGYGNFTGERYLTYRLTGEEERNDPTTLSEDGVYVSRITPYAVEYNGNKHVVETFGKKKKGYSYDLFLDVYYGGSPLVYGKDYKLSYYNNVAANVGIKDAKEPYVLVRC